MRVVSGGRVVSVRSCRSPLSPLADSPLATHQSPLAHDPRPRTDQALSTTCAAASSWPWRAISFHVGPGEVYGLLGPNGAGKTTALRILSTVLRPTAAGRRSTASTSSRQAAAVRRQIGFVSANTARLRSHDRPGRWSIISAGSTGLPDDELSERMERLFDRLKMNDIRDVLGAKMSTGMKQKVLGGPGRGPRSARC